MRSPILHRDRVHQSRSGLSNTRCDRIGGALSRSTIRRVFSAGCFRERVRYSPDRGTRGQAGPRYPRSRPVQARDARRFRYIRGALADYADVLGESGLAEYRRLATATWDTRHASPDRTRSAAEFSDLALKGILDFFAERDGNVEAQIALRASNLSSPWGYLQLAEFCLSEGREAEALKRAEEGLWLFEDRRPDEQLLLLSP